MRERTTSLCWRPHVLTALLGLLGLAGCTPGQATVSGKVAFPANIQPGKSDGVSIAFVQEAGDKGFNATYNRADQTFVATNVPPGKYKITFNIQPYPGDADAAKRTALYEKLDRKYDVKTTTLHYDVTGGSSRIILDLDKGTVTKE